MGTKLLSLRGDGPWRGKSCTGTVDRGGRAFLKMENAYVHGDGNELRLFPGFSCILDLTDQNNSLGYGRNLTEAVRPIYDTSPNDTYQYYYTATDSRAQTMVARAKMSHLHWFEQVGDTLLIGGESRFREIPIYRTRVPGELLTIVSVGASGGRWIINLSNTINGNSATDATGASLNGLTIGDVVYFEGITVANATLQAALDANFNGRQHEVKSASSNQITLHTTTAVGIGATAITNTSAQYVYRINYNRANTYSTPNGVAVYTNATNQRPDDPDALTTWRVIERLSRTDTAQACHPAWVANRQRDFGDQVSANDTEGIYINDTGTRGASRREKRQLPYRMNPEPATDRVLIAAPGYGCMFQVPLKVPTQPQFDFPFPSPGGDADGLIWNANSFYDRPRSLGIPKGRLIDCTVEAVQPSPSHDPSNFGAVAGVGDPANGMPPGVYLMSIAYEDEALGEEGLASEPVEITIPNNSYVYALVVNYMHPGYVMPECLATKMNVYLTEPNGEAMAFYGSFPLREIGFTSITTLNNSSFSSSAVYGFEPQSPDGQAVFRRFRLPLIDDGDTPDETILDPERLAPQSASMPRGAECVRYIRGVMLSAGAMGNVGGSLQLWAAKASVRYGSDAFPYLERDELHIRVYGETASVPSADQDGDAQTSMLGIAGRCFPDAYQGIEVVSKELWPAVSLSQRVDKVVNRAADSMEESNRRAAWFERLRLTRDMFGRSRSFGTAPTTLADEQRLGKDVWFVMPKGQLQLGDPGAPWRSSKSTIQITDPKRGDDIVALGELAGNAILCSRKETYTYSWYRSAGSEIPNLLSNEHGCIAANSMVEFDGGLAWLSERGPVAFGASLQFVGRDIQEDFYGSSKRYLHDSRGMMRHSWGCHDASRGIVLWGVVTDATQELFYSGMATGDTYSWSELDDGGKSRMPCDEVIIWNYRANAFSTWRPPAGLEVYWMRMLRDANGEVFLCFLARDGRIYAFDDAAHDSAMSTNTIEAAPTAKQATASTTMAFTLSQGTGQNGAAVTGHNGDRRHLRVGMLVEALDASGALIWQTTIASITTVSASGGTVELAAAQTWLTTTRFRIGGRQHATLISAYLGAEALDNLPAQAVQMRYSLFGNGSANAKVSALKTEFTDTATTPREIAFTPADAWPTLGVAATSTNEQLRISRRRRFAQGGADATELAVKIELAGSAQVRVEDIALEVGV